MNWYPRVFALAIAVVVTGIGGCGAERPPDVVSSGSPIQGGMNDGTHTFAVGILGQTSRGTALCSGALLAPNLVATARHCVAAIPANGVIACPTTQFGALTPTSSLVVTTDSDIRTNATRFAVSQVIVPSAADQTAVCGDDVALLILSQNVSLPVYVTPVLNPPMTDHTVYSTTVTAIGYGVSSPTDMTGTTAGIRRIRQDIPLTCISNDKTFQDCLPSLASEVTASEFVSGDGTCEGDSGSNAFEQTNFDAGRWVSFGVLSRGGTSGGMCVGAIYSRFDAWSALIIDAANQAATMGGYPVPSWAARDGGTGPVDAGGDASPPRDAGPAADASRDASSDAAKDASSDAPSDAAKDAVREAAPPGPDGGTSRDAGAGDGSRPDGGGGAGGQGGSSGGVGPNGPAANGCSCAMVTTGAPGRSQGSDALLAFGLASVLVAIGRRPRAKSRSAAERSTS
ncbi:MAG TPA: trypsin-like serine protease [Polyangia bacterium]|nr:trypsin-like serine protease [Polyangia bacterium]